MIKYIFILLAVITVLLAGPSSKFSGVVATASDNAGLDTSVYEPCCDCFWGRVYSQDMWPRRTYHPLLGATVSLYYRQPSADTLMGTNLTNAQGMYQFCNHPGGWPHGTYVIKVLCEEKTVDREIDSNIRWDFYIPNPYPCPEQPVPGIPEP